MKCIQKIRKKVVKAKKEREECPSKHSKTRAPCRALGDVESVSFTILALCRNSELYERKLHFGKFFSLRHTTHVQINHAVTSAVKTIHVLMGEHAASCANTPNKSSTAYAPMDFLENGVKRKVLHPASSYNCKQRSRKCLLHTRCSILQGSPSTKPSAISLLKMDSFGLFSSPSA
mgnify:CR=1 FL=1